MIKTLYLPELVLIVLLYSCSKQSINDKLIPKEDFIEIIVDINIADGLSRITRGTNLPPELFQDTALVNYVFLKHGYSKKLFDSTTSYYAKQKPQELKEIMEIVMERLHTIEMEVQKETTKDK
jgi:hypothetical protein